MRVKENGKTVVEIPARSLADDAPVYVREAAPKPAPHSSDNATLLAGVPVPDESALHSALEVLLAHPSIASKRWVWRQYDHMVRLGAAVLPGSDAAVFVVREAGKILAATTDCNAIYCLQDPRLGARIAVAEAARNLACSGARPIAVTDNLNFGNPHRPENFLQLREAVEGLAEACRVYGTPVTGGNVSLYNQNPSGAIDPTPTVGMVGLIDEMAHVTTQAFKEAGDAIYLLGGVGSEMGASHHILCSTGKKAGAPPDLDDRRELALHEALRKLIRAGIARSAHDCSEGGLAVALAESCLSAERELGARVKLSPSGERADIALFNESQSRALVTVRPADEARAGEIFAACGVDFERIGEVCKGPLSIGCDRLVVSWDVAKLGALWGESIEKIMA